MSNNILCGRQYKATKVTMFIMLFTSSLVSVQFGGISINRLGMLPFLFTVFVNEVQNMNWHRMLFYKDEIPYLCFLVLSVVSAMLAIIMPISGVEGFISAQISYAIQILAIYIPIIILLFNSSKKYVYCSVMYR